MVKHSPKTCKILPMWPNFAKSGHAGHGCKFSFAWFMESQNQSLTLLINFTLSWYTQAKSLIEMAVASLRGP